MFTIDASVHINALNSRETGSEDSRALLARIFSPAAAAEIADRPSPAQLVFSPLLLVVELAAVVARVFDSSIQGIALAQAVRLLPGQVWVLLDDLLADEAARLAAQHRLRGADAVYAAVAKRHNTTLVTLDQQQLTRLNGAITVWTPAQALDYLHSRPSL